VFAPDSAQANLVGVSWVLDISALGLAEPWAVAPEMTQARAIGLTGALRPSRRHNEDRHAHIFSTTSWLSSSTTDSSRATVASRGSISMPAVGSFRSAQPQAFRSSASGTSMTESHPLNTNAAAAPLVSK
jgi:hypothetical protein